VGLGCKGWAKHIRKAGTPKVGVLRALAVPFTRRAWGRKKRKESQSLKKGIVRKYWQDDEKKGGKTVTQEEILVHKDPRPGKHRRGRNRKGKEMSHLAKRDSSQGEEFQQPKKRIQAQLHERLPTKPPSP